MKNANSSLFDFLESHGVSGRVFVETEAGRFYAVDAFQGESLGLPWMSLRFEVDSTPVTVAVHRHESGQGIRLRLSHGGEQILRLAFGVEWALPFSDESYTLIPGIFYNGNDDERPRDIVRWGRQDLEVLGFAACSAAAPALLHRAKDGTSTFLTGSPLTNRGWSGWQIDRAGGTVSLRFPADETRIPVSDHLPDPDDRFTCVKPGQALRLSCSESERTCSGVGDLFEWYFSETWDGSDPGKNDEDLRLQSSRVFRHLLDHHWTEDARGRSVFLNTVFEGERMRGLETPEWGARMNVYMGWSYGPGAALPMLRSGPREREQATGFLDLLAAEAVAPGGLVYPRYDISGEWEKAEQGTAELFHHVRMPAAFADFMFRAWKEERDRGVDHPAWLSAAVRVTDALCDLWQREKDFGFYVDYMAETPVLLDGGSCAGAFALRALARRLDVLEKDEDREAVSAVVREASDHYAQHYLARGHATGGPLDIDKADDSESACALGAAYMLCSRIWPEEAVFLDRAKATAHLFSTWVLSWSAPFPRESALEGRDPRGGVLANVQNRHIGPGICTDSGHWLEDLADRSGDPRYRALHRHIVHGALQFVCRHDGDLWGGDLNGYPELLPFRVGQVTEQVNLTDWLQDSGETWHVSASWPAMSVLLMAFDAGMSFQP